MLFPNEGITFANRSSLLASLVSVTSSTLLPLPLPLTNLSLHTRLIEPFFFSLLNRNLAYHHIRQLQPTQACLLLLPVTLPLALAPSLPLHTCFPELSAKSLQSMLPTTPMSSLAPKLTNRNIFETPGVRNVADRYAAQGGTATHLPGVATPRGMFAMLFLAMQYCSMPMSVY
jgi:hypothetical protein